MKTATGKNCEGGSFATNDKYRSRHFPHGHKDYKHADPRSRRIEMKLLTAKRRVKILYAVAALVTTCGAAMAASDSEQFQR
ncbi:MAG TPA: hypothetical protein VHW95_15230, partial [Steroidobacteraceae bacterium]|nr:hypothetical protein [Steroidobacteraceae bacterium]